MRKGKIGLCLSGGGITGSMYEVGCIAALEENVEGLDSFDCYVGTAAGATIALALSSGFPALRLYRALLDPADDFFPLKRHHLLQLDGGEWKRVIKSSIGALRRLITSATSRPTDLNLWNELDRFWDSLPAGFFSLEPFEQFMTEFMVRRGIPFAFPQLQKPLFFVANDLDSGQRAVFGDEALRDIPIPRALAAASAIPILYAPIRIGKRDYIAGGLDEIGNADIASQAGCELVIIVNPDVPIYASPGANEVPTGHGPRSRVRDKGLIWVYNQALRVRSEARLRQGLEAFQLAQPSTRVVLLEPDPENATVFMHSPMNFAARRTILEEAYKATTRALRDPHSAIHRTLIDYGLRIRQPVSN